MLLPVQNSDGNFLFVLASEPGNGRDELTHLPFLSKLQFNKKRKQLELRKSRHFASSIDLNQRRFGTYQMRIVYLYAVTNYVFILKREWATNENPTG